MLKSANAKRSLLTGLTAIAIAVAIVGSAYWYMSGGKTPTAPDEDDQVAAALTPPPDGVATGDIQIGTAPYRLTDMNGRTLTETSFPDKFKLVFFGFTNCTDICPIALQTMTVALKDLGLHAAQVQPLFITVDPKRDTIAVMKNYLKSFSPQILGVIGTPQQLKAAEDSFKVYASDGKAEVEDGDEDAHDAHHHMDMDDDEDVVSHSDNIFLLAPGNKLINVYNGDVSADELAKAMKAAIK